MRWRARRRRVDAPPPRGRTQIAMRAEPPVSSYRAVAFASKQNNTFDSRLQTICGLHCARRPRPSCPSLAIGIARIDTSHSSSVGVRPALPARSVRHERIDHRSSTRDPFPMSDACLTAHRHRRVPACKEAARVTGIVERRTRLPPHARSLPHWPCFVFGTAGTATTAHPRSRVASARQAVQPHGIRSWPFFTRGPSTAWHTDPTVRNGRCCQRAASRVLCERPGDAASPDDDSLDAPCLPHPPRASTRRGTPQADQIGHRGCRQALCALPSPEQSAMHARRSGDHRPRHTKAARPLGASWAYRPFGQLYRHGRLVLPKVSAHRLSNGAAPLYIRGHPP